MQTLVNCIHAAPDPQGNPNGVQCGLGLNGGRPSLGVCGNCPPDKRKPIDPEKPALPAQPPPIPRRMPAVVVTTPEQQRVAVEAAQKAMAVPRDQWPLSVKALAPFAGPLDKGIGDVVERHLGVAGEAWKAMYTKLTGSTCGCEDRKRKLNLLYPIP